MRRSQAAKDVIFHQDYLNVGIQALPEELRRKVGEYRVETYQSLALCADCDAVLLYLNEEKQMHMHVAFFMNDDVRFCAACHHGQYHTLAKVQERFKRLRLSLLACSK